MFTKPTRIDPLNTLIVQASTRRICVFLNQMIDGQVSDDPNYLLFKFVGGGVTSMSFCLRSTYRLLVSSVLEIWGTVPSRGSKTI